MRNSRTEVGPEGTDVLTRSLVCVTLICLAGAALWVATREFQAHLFSAQSPSRAFESLLLEGGGPVPPSVRGRRGVMIGCLDALAPGAVQFQAREDVREVAARCDALAATVLATSPTLSAAHLVQMQARFALEDLPGTVAALQASGETAGRALWISLRRMQVVHALPEVMRPLVEATTRADAALMFESYEGRVALAQFYGRDTALRPLLLEVAEARPAEEQASFLDLTRRVLLGGT